jgi:Axonemal dynein light chain
MKKNHFNKDIISKSSSQTPHRSFRFPSSSTPNLQTPQVFSDFPLKNPLTMHSNHNSIKGVTQGESLQEILGVLKTSPKLPTKLDILTQYSNKQTSDSNLGTPATRKDVKTLADWLNSMLQKALSVTRSPESLYETANTIYKVCFQEIIRQVKVQCKERGDLIKQVWETYQSLFSHAIKVSQIKYEFLQKTHANEKCSIEKTYEKKINELIKANNELNAQKSKVEKELKIKLEALDIKVYREGKLIQALEVFKQQYAVLKEDLLIQKEENRVSKIRLENIQNSKKKAFQKYRPKAVESLKKNLNEDPILNFKIEDDPELIIEKISKYGKK